VFEIHILVVIWLGMGFSFAMLTAWALNGMVIKSDWLGALILSVLGPIQLWIFLRMTDGGA
jgi:hypothetical protein